MKVKLFNTTNDDMETMAEPGYQPRLRIQFKKKRGDIGTWYEIFKEMKLCSLNEILMSPHTENQAGPVEEAREAEQEEAQVE